MFGGLALSGVAFFDSFGTVIPRQDRCPFLNVKQPSIFRLPLACFPFPGMPRHAIYFPVRKNHDFFYRPPALAPLCAI
jgi:hypothetical protein